MALISSFNNNYTLFLLFCQIQLLEIKKIEKEENMEIKICANNIVKNKIEEYVFQFDENTTILDMKEKLNIENNAIEFPKYNAGPMRTCLFEGVFPYIERKGRIYCDVNINDVKIVELLNTMKITDVIEFDYNFDGIGGGHIIVQIIENVIKAAGVFSNLKDVYDFASYIERKISKKGLTNNRYLKKHNVFSIESFIFSELSWNHFILAEKLDISPEKAKLLLKVFGYNWDNSKKLFYITKENKEKQMKTILDIAIRVTDENFIE